MSANTDAENAPSDAPAPATPPPGMRVRLVSARPMFRRTFGKVLEALRPGLAIEHATTPGADDAALAEALVLIDGGGLAAEAVGETVGLALGAAATRAVVLVLDETDDACTDAAMAAGAQGVMVKAAPPGILAEWLDALLDGEIVRPAPSVPLGPEALGDAVRARLSARRQKLLRLQMGGTSVTETARALGLTPAKVVTEMRIVMDIVRGRDGG